MVIDKEEHRTILLELINKASFSGQFVEIIVELKNAITVATITKDDGHIDFSDTRSE